MEGGKHPEPHHLDAAADEEAAAQLMRVPHRVPANHPGVPYLGIVRPASSWRASMKSRSESRFR